MSKNITIYRYICPEGKSYIGQTNNEDRRKNQHKNTTSKLNTKFGNAIREYGFDNLIYEVLEICGKDIADSREEYYVNQYDSFENGYNGTVNGQYIENNFENYKWANMKYKQIRINEETREVLAESLLTTNNKINSPAMKLTKQIVDDMLKKVSNIEKFDEDMLYSLSKISKNKYITINNKYISSSDILFKGVVENQRFHFLALCIYIADQQNEFNKKCNQIDNKDFVLLDLDVKVFKILYGTNKSYFIKKDIFTNNIQSKEEGLIFSSFENNVDRIILCIKKSIFENSGEKSYTKVYLGDFIKTRSVPALRVKLKIYKFANITNYLEGLEELDSNVRFNDIKIRMNDFKDWSNCGNKVSQFLTQTLNFINKENSEKINFKYSTNRIVIISVDPKSYLNHVLLNCEELEKITDNRKINNRKVKVIGGE